MRYLALFAVLAMIVLPVACSCGHHRAPRYHFGVSF